MAETLGAMAMLLAAHGYAAQPHPATRIDGSGDSAPDWWLWQVVEEGVVVGDAGFHGPPADDGPLTVEIGYNVVPALRRRGIATRACRLLLDQAWRDGAELVLAETDPSNVASQRVLLAAGFRPTAAAHAVVDGPDHPVSFARARSVRVPA